MALDWRETHISMGRIGAAYGIKGWVKLISHTDPIANLLNYKQLKIDRQGELQTIEIDECRPQGKGLVAHIKGCDDRDLTRLYTGKELYVAKQDLPALEEGYYWHQLEGLKVINQAGEDLGAIKSMLETGANDVMIVASTDSSIDDVERLIPYIEDQVVVKVDLQQGCVTVNWESDYLAD